LGLEYSGVLRREELLVADFFFKALVDVLGCLFFLSRQSHRVARQERPRTEAKVSLRNRARDMQNGISEFTGA
jgi:hypothetical protein